MTPEQHFTNPFRPGAGHRPPYLAGRGQEKDEFRRLLRQDVILENLVLTGLRGVGKTVLLEEFKPLAIHGEWLWVGTDLSETATLTEDRLAMRLITDLAAVSSSIEIGRTEVAGMGFRPEVGSVPRMLSYEVLVDLFQRTAGLTVDKLKAVFELVWHYARASGSRGIVFAYDEAQNLADHAADREYPLSLMLDLFQSLQRRDLPLMLVLVGLPTLFPKVVEARTYAERMFHVATLGRLTEDESRQAIVKPIEQAGCPYPLSKNLIDSIIAASAGYPYFIQFICREVYDVALQKHDAGQPLQVSVEDITRKLDNDFFAGRWARATERQRDLLRVIAQLPNCDDEFTVQEVVEQSKLAPSSPFSPSHANQILGKLIEAGLVYKNRHGRYTFAVPLLGQFIRRQPTP